MGNIIYPLWAECPALTRLTCVGPPVLSLAFVGLEFFPAGLALASKIFACSLSNVGNLYLWTFFLTCFFSQMFSDGMSFLFGLITVYMVMLYFPVKEKEMGSTAFFIWILLTSALINVIYLTIMFCESLIWPSPAIYFQSVRGFWPLILVVITLSSLSDPDGSTNFWGLVQIPNKWYPISLVGFFCLINRLKILWDLVAALLVGYGFVYLNLERFFFPAPARAGCIELQCCRGGRCSMLGASWIPATTTSGYSNDAGLSDFGRTSGQQLTGAFGGNDFQVFAGSGNVLGDGSSEPALMQQLHVDRGGQASEQEEQHAGTGLGQP